MVPNLTVVISIGILAFIVLYGALELVWALWENRKAAASNRSE